MLHLTLIKSNWKNEQQKSSDIICIMTSERKYMLLIWSTAQLAILLSKEMINFLHCQWIKIMYDAHCPTYPCGSYLLYKRRSTRDETIKNRILKSIERINFKHLFKNLLKFLNKIFRWIIQYVGWHFRIVDKKALLTYQF